MRFIVTSVLFVLLKAIPNSDISTKTFQRIVVVPDTHGDVHGTLRSLWLAHNDINQNDAGFEMISQSFVDFLLFGDLPSTPIEGRRLDVAVIQLGDMVDRGPDSVDCIKIFRAIPSILGWRVYNLIGNHEIAGFLGRSDELVHEDDLGQFVSLKDRAKEIHRLTALNSLGFIRIGLPNIIGDFAVNPNTLFVHGGIEPDWMEWFLNEKNINSKHDVNEMNRALSVSLTTNLADAVDMLECDNSIVWDRTLANAPEESICGEYLEKILEQFRVSRIVVGHTPQVDLSVKTRCGGKIILADVMMSRWMIEGHVGRPTALVFKMNTTGYLDSIDVLHTDIDGESREHFLINSS